MPSAAGSTTGVSNRSIVPACSRNNSSGSLNWRCWLVCVAGVGSGGVVRSDGLYGGTADERDRCTDGPGGGSRKCVEDGSARRFFTGRCRTCAWYSGGDGGRPDDDQSVVRC